MNSILTTFITFDIQAWNYSKKIGHNPNPDSIKKMFDAKAKTRKDIFDV